jgi:hydrogenase nickel incorporation protein HypA/HybF
VRLGEFSGVEPELFASAFEELTSDSPMDGAALRLEQAPLEGVCDDCGNQFQIERFCFRCNRCGSTGLTVRGGEEVLLESVIFEEAER